MTIKKVAFRLILMVVFYFISFSLLTFLFSSDGLLVSVSLEKRYKELEKEEEEYKLQIASLEKKIASASDEKSMDDIALSLGYNREGEKVFYFDSEDNLSNDEEKIAVSEKTKIYKGLTTKVIVLYSLIPPVLLLLIGFILSIFKRKSRDESVSVHIDRGGNYDDYDF